MITSIKLFKLLENKNNIDYRIVKSTINDTTTFTLYNDKSFNQKLIGKVVISNKKTNRSDFKHLTDLQFQSFSGSNYYCVDLIHVYKYYRREGFTKILFELAFDYIKSKQGKIVYLNAHPIESNLSLDQLIDMYIKYGFQVISKYNNTADMIKVLD